MHFPSLDIILFLIAAGFAAAFIDSVVGGGGLVTVPALLMTGLSPGMVLGTNKFGGTMASLTSSATFFLSGKIDKRTVLWLFPLSFAGAALGSYVVQQIPSAFLRPLVVGMLAVILVYTLTKKKAKSAERQAVVLTWKSGLLLGTAALAIGFYDGFFGPGTGSFLLFLFLLAGFDYVRASGNAKVLNLGSNVASLLLFALYGSVQFGYGLILSLAMIAGALSGAVFAIRRGSAYVKPLFMCVTVVLIGKQLWDILMK